MRRIRIRPSSVVFAFAVAGLLATALTAAALAWPMTPFAGGLNLSSISERRAEAFARVAADDEAARRASIAETRKSIAQSPANPTAWLRLAWLDSLSHGGLGASGDHALATSYAIAPYGPDVTDWRLVFAFNHWDVISGENREAVMDELRVASTPRSARGLLARVENPAGRIALSLMLGVMESESGLRQAVI